MFFERDTVSVYKRLSKNIRKINSTLIKQTAVNTGTFSMGVFIYTCIQKVLLDERTRENFGRGYLKKVIFEVKTKRTKMKKCLYRKHTHITTGSHNLTLTSADNCWEIIIEMCHSSVVVIGSQSSQRRCGDNVLQDT